MSDLILEISKLSIFDRIQLVQDILETVSTDATKHPEFVLSDAHQTELDRRSNSLANGTAKTVSWDSIEKALQERYGIYH